MYIRVCNTGAGDLSRLCVFECIGVISSRFGGGLTFLCFFFLLFLLLLFLFVCFFFFKQKTAYEIRNCDWSSDVCSSDLPEALEEGDDPFVTEVPLPTVVIQSSEDRDSVV